MIRLAMDGKARLIAFEARPTASDTGAGAGAMDWDSIFRAAGLDKARFTDAAPNQVPSMMADQRAAWTGTYAEGRSEVIRVEVAAYRGKLVSFAINGDWRKTEGSAGSQNSLGRIISLGVCGILIVGAVFLALRNLRTGRGDRRGAARIAAFWFALVMCTWIAGANLGESFTLEIVMAASFALLAACFFWAVYIAAEPFVRKHWPDALIPVTRILTGRLRDPLVASNVLAGLVVLALYRILSVGISRMNPAEPINGNSALVLSNWADAGGLAVPYEWSEGLCFVAGMFFLYLLLRQLVRKGWIAAIIWALFMARFWGSTSFGTENILYLLLGASVVPISLWILRRFGLLALLVAGGELFAFRLPESLPMVPASWYSGRVVSMLLLHAVAAAWALWVIVSAQRRPSTESAA
jgi:hypothetical protein